MRRQEALPGRAPQQVVTAYPNTSDDPAVTGAWFTGLLVCRPDAFALAEEAELGTCANN